MDRHVTPRIILDFKSQDLYDEFKRCCYEETGSRSMAPVLRRLVKDYIRKWKRDVN